jgi:LacI family transcriptional regulator
VTTLPRHTAIFAVNDETALEVVAAAQKAHRAIPRELTLCGVDNVPSLCESSSPTVSSVQIDHERAGYMAARMIGEKTSGVATIGPMLVVRRESTAGRGRRDRFILDAIGRIRREACDGLTAADVAASYPGSRRTFERRFREAAGHSVLDEIMHVRLERVFAILSHREKLLGTIADFCGFGCEYELRKVFRARTGMSMREWRKRNQQLYFSQNHRFRGGVLLQLKCTCLAIQQREKNGSTFALTHRKTLCRGGFGGDGGPAT